MFGQNTRELGWFVKAGMTPAQALRDGHDDSGAECSAWTKRARPARARRFADIVAVEGNPLEDIDVLFTGVRWVMKNGARRRRDA